MKKYSLLLLSVALLAGCANSSSKQSSQKTQTSSTVQLSAHQKTLDNATAEYKDFVEMQIDQLPDDTEGFRDTLKAGNLKKLKTISP